MKSKLVDFKKLLHVQDGDIVFLKHEIDFVSPTLMTISYITHGTISSATCVYRNHNGEVKICTVDANVLIKYKK